MSDNKILNSIIYYLIFNTNLLLTLFKKKMASFVVSKY